MQKFTRILLSSSPHVFSGIGDIADITDVLARMRSVPELHLFHNAVMHESLYQMTGVYSAEAKEHVAQKITECIAHAAVDQKFRLVHTFGDMVLSAVEQGYATGEMAQVFSHGLRSSQGHGALLDIVIDDVLLGMQHSQRTEVAVHPQTSAFMRDQRVCFTAFLPQDKKNARITVVAADAIGLRNQYGDVTHIARDSHAVAAVDRRPVSPTEQILLSIMRLQSFVGEDYKKGRFPRKNVVASSVAMIADAALQGELLAAMEEDDPGKFFDSVRNALRAIAAQEDVQPLHLENADFKEIAVADAETMLLAEMHQWAIQERIEEGIGILLSDLSLASQKRFLAFLVASDQKTLERIGVAAQAFSNRTDRICFFTSFLSLECGEQEMGERILALVEKYGQKTSAAVFRKYAEIVSFVDGIVRYAEEQISEKLSQKEVRALQENLLAEAKQVIIASDATMNSDMIQDYLRNSSASLHLFRAMIRSLRETRRLHIEQVRGVSFVMKNGTAFSQESLRMMRLLYEKRNAMYSEHFRETLMKNFDERIRDPQTIFAALAHNDVPTSFASFAQKPDGTVAFGTFVTDEQYGGVQMGSALLEKALDFFAKKHPIVAACNPFERITQNYINKQGFVAERYFLYDGQPSFAITRDDQKRYARAQRKEIADGAEDISRLGEKTGDVIDVFVPKEKLAQLQENLLLGDYVVTAFYDDGSRFLVRCVRRTSAESIISDAV